MFHSIDGVNIPLEDWDNIAISISGGADSAILTYLLCDLIIKNKYSTKVHLINNTRMWKLKPWQQYDAERVLTYLENKFPSIQMIRHHNLIAPELEYGNSGKCLKDEYGKDVSGDNIQIRSFAEFVSFHYNVKCHYNAVTHNPLVKLPGAMVERDVRKDGSNEHLEFMYHMGIIASHPLRFVDKSWVVKQYIENDIMDLFDLTRSCEGTIDGLDYRTYVPYQHVRECEKCFWCMERNWAKGVNGV